MRGWLIANRYAVSAVALTLLCVVALAMLVQPAACANPTQPSGAPAPEPTLQPVAEAATASPPPSGGDALATPSPGPPSKNLAGEPQPAMPIDERTGAALVACSAGGDLDWSTTAGALQVVCQCSLTLPWDGWAFLAAGGSLSGGRCDCEYEAHFRLGIDGTQGDPASDRWVNIYSDAGDGMDAVLAVSALRPLKAGTHTFYLLGRRADGTGTVLLHDPSLAVIAWPAAVK